MNPRCSGKIANQCRFRSGWGSPALSMKAALLRCRMTENSLENKDRCTGRRSWIIESAGEPRMGTTIRASGGQLDWLRHESFAPDERGEDTLRVSPRAAAWREREGGITGPPGLI